MVRSFIRYLRGYKRVSFRCSNPESFINAVKGTGEVWGIKKDGARRMSFTCSASAYRTVLTRSEKWGIKPLILYEKGLRYTLARHKNRIGLLVGILFGLILLYLSTLFVWEVRVQGNETLSPEEIVDTLEYLGFGEGSFIPDVDFDWLHNEFLLTEKRISWISVNIKGTVAYAEIKEREFPPEPVDRNKCVNIIAARAGIIERVDAHIGAKEVAAGDAVLEGQLLISSFMETRKSGTILRSASGSVWARTLRSYEQRIPLSYYERVLTGNRKKRYSMRILGKTFKMHFGGAPSYSAYDMDRAQGNITLFDRIVLPIRVICDTYTRYELKKVFRTKEQAKALAMADLYRRMEEELTAAEILTREISQRADKENFYLHCEIECMEDIALEKSFYFDEKQLKRREQH